MALRSAVLLPQDLRHRSFGAGVPRINSISINVSFYVLDAPVVIVGAGLACLTTAMALGVGRNLRSC